MNILKRRPTLHRRSFLKGTGVSLVLPLLDAMCTNSRSVATAGDITPNETPRRAVFCFFGLGINGRDFTPADMGFDYAITPILKPLEELRREFTVVSGLKLTYSGGHVGDRTFLTGTNTRNAGAKLRVSCDQELAQAIGRQTRFPSLSLGIKRGTGFGGDYDQTLSWSPSGTPIPSENRPHVLFDQLFRHNTAETLNAREAEFVRRASLLDSLGDEARRLNGSLGVDDRRKLDEYLTGIRDLERRMQEDKDWLRKPKPNVAKIEFGKEQRPSQSSPASDARGGITPGSQTPRPPRERRRPPRQLVEHRLRPHAGSASQKLSGGRSGWNHQGTRVILGVRFEIIATTSLKESP